MKNKVTAVIVLLLVVFGLAGVRAQTTQTSKLMREKLDHAQKILEAVVTGDWASLDAHSRALERLTEDPRWTVLKYPEYATYSRAFVRSLQDLRQIAAQRDSDKTPEAYTTMILKCVDCHRYLARTRIAR